MAIRVSGVSVRWGGSTASTAASGTQLLEVTEATLDLQRGAPVARTAKWSLDLGTITLAALTRDAVPDSDYGQRRLLEITAQSDTGATTTATQPPLPDGPLEPGTGSGQDNTAATTFTVFSADCVYLGANISAKVNDVWRFDHLFKVSDTRGGNTPYPS